jgi:hypothetical protein
MAAILPLAAAEITSDSTFETGSSLLYTSTGNVLANVLVTNTSSVEAECYVFITTSTFSSSPQIAYRIPVPARNTYETFKFTMDLGDELRVAGHAGLVFYAQGIDQDQV